MSRSSHEILEFDELRELLRKRTTSAPGRRAIDQLSFRFERAALHAEFAAIAEAARYLRTGELGLGGLADPDEWMEKLAAPGAVLVPSELMAAVSLLDATATLRAEFLEQERNKEFPLLTGRVRSLADYRMLAAAIRRAILPNGEISDDASAELRRIRGGIGRTRETIHKTLERILHARKSASRSEATADDYVTRRNERFVIPVRSSEQRSVQGVVHAASATGQTVFVEPLETIELNNRLVELNENEAAEITRILAELTGRLAAEQTELLQAAETLAELDSLAARGRFLRDFDACVPEFADTPTIALTTARHPVLESRLRSQGRAVVPLTLAMGNDERVLVISGPNTGGKTVALKTVGLAVLAAQSGIPVAAQSARLGIFDRVLADIGDEQSLSADLSTFSAHILNLKAMFGMLTPSSLVLVDEMGTGTAPEEGAALAVALLEEFRERRCLVMATTHHDRLKAYASTTPGVVNAAVEFDEERLAPTYKLLVGIPGGSSGIAIAGRLGLDPVIVERARALMAPESREAAGLIAYLHRSREALEKMQQELAAQSAQLEQERRELRDEWVGRQKKRIAELEQRFSEALAAHEREMAAALDAVRETELRAQIEKQTRRRIAQARTTAKDEADAAVVAHLSESQPDLGTPPAEAARPPSPADLVPGVKIRVRGFSAPVVLRRRDETSADVEAGPLRMKVALSEITAIVADPAQGGRRPAAGRVTAPVAADAAGQPDEINVIGCTVEEATERVDKFVDRAVLAGKAHLRVIHGHGKGALRRGLGEFLTAHPLVESIHAEADERGGAAVTVVELKD